MAKSTLALLAKQINCATRSMDPIHSRELTNQNRFRTPCGPSHFLINRGPWVRNCYFSRALIVHTIKYVWFKDRKKNNVLPQTKMNNKYINYAEKMMETMYD